MVCPTDSQELDQGIPKREAIAEARACLDSCESAEIPIPFARFSNTERLSLLPGPNSSGPLFVSWLIRATASSLFRAGMNTLLSNFPPPMTIVSIELSSVNLGESSYFSWSGLS